MAEITKQRQGQLVKKAFEVLMEHPEGLPAHEVIARVEQQLGASPFEKTTYASNPKVRRFEKIVRCSTIGPVNAGWLVKEKGQWRLTDAGSRAYSAFPDPVQLMTEAHRLYREWKKEQPEEEASEETATDTPG